MSNDTTTPTAHTTPADTTLQRRIYLGRTADRSRVFADVELRTRHARPGQSFTTTAHESVTSYVEFAAMFEVIAFSEREAYRGGQVPTDERVIVDRDGSPLTPANRRYIERAWETSHLNGMNAGCDHMREGIDYAPPAASDLPERYGQPDLQGWKLKNLVCAESGYRWGSAWLVKALDDDLAANMRHLLGSLPGRGETVEA